MTVWRQPRLNPASVLNEGSRARRTFWTASIGKTKEFSEGTHDRLFDVTRLTNAPEFLESGLLVKAGTKQPLIVPNPESILVLHKTRLDEEGRLALTRLDAELKQLWMATLPFHELQNRFELAEQLLLYGNVQSTQKGVTRWQEELVALDLRDGKTQRWNVQAERVEQ